ncbi:hypothetical protein CI41S_27740 [Bradyrhizobium ivorense]|nr:hypothetical protein CI41S_27740 [Bradyrhizobium ivorense]
MSFSHSRYLTLRHWPTSVKEHMKPYVNVSVDVAFWPKTDMRWLPGDVRLLGESRMWRIYEYAP